MAINKMHQFCFLLHLPLLTTDTNFEQKKHLLLGLKWRISAYFLFFPTLPFVFEHSVLIVSLFIKKSRCDFTNQTKEEK